MGVFQRHDTDCGCAALATLLGLSYEYVAEAWVRVARENPTWSGYWHLVEVSRVLGYAGKRVAKPTCAVYIQRMRSVPRMHTSHWVVRYKGSDRLWCPYTGDRVFKDYEMKHGGHCFEIHG